MRRSVWIIAALGVAAGLAAGVLLGRGLSGRPAAPSAPTSAGRTASGAPAGRGGRALPPLVAVAHPKQTTIPATISLTANIASLNTAVIYPKVAGYLQAVTVRPGDVVRPGQVLAVIEHSQLETQVGQAQASLRSAQAALALAQATVRRDQYLMSQGAIALQDLQTAQTQAREDQAQVANQEAALQNAELTVASATITAPFNGIVASRSLDPGAYVTPGTSTPILTIADLNRIDVLVNVTEVEMAAVQVGSPAQITVDAYPGRTFQGRVTRIAGSVDPTSRTVQVEIDIPNPGHLLRPGMYATTTLSVGAQRNVLVVPLSAIVSLGDQHAVWVVVDNVAHQQAVSVGEAAGSLVPITSGLRLQDDVVVRGIDQLREGEQVQTAGISF